MLLLSCPKGKMPVEEGILVGGNSDGGIQLRLHDCSPRPMVVEPAGDGSGGLRMALDFNFFFSCSPSSIMFDF